jgi:signal transduction histidine kinase
MNDVISARIESPGEISGSPVEDTDLMTLVCHREWLPADTRLRDVCRQFESHDEEYCAVKEGGRVIGLCSRSQVGSLMGHRYGFALYNDHPIRRHLAREPLIIRRGTPVREVLERALGRPGKRFHEDAALIGADDEYLGIITVPTLVRLQSALVAERFAAQEAWHRQMQDLSRQAGMAELAAGVLHNIGNVLNSVNVSAGLVTDMLRRSETGRLEKLARLLGERQSDLAAFLTGDARGKLIPAYVMKLAEHLHGERGRLLAEMTSLTSHIDHIKQIVMVQQGYAKAGGIVEPVRPEALVEDSLKLFVNSFARHQITLEKRFVDTPRILVDRHKVLQILINLLRNAKQALQTSSCPARRLVIDIRPAEASQVAILVQDNGVGIAPEHLSRIFTHGFTTKKDGHGFGLHASALAAKELGGSLSAFSDGPGRGARFALELPVEHGIAVASA